MVLVSVLCCGVAGGAHDDLPVARVTRGRPRPDEQRTRRCQRRRDTVAGPYLFPRHIVCTVPSPTQGLGSSEVGDRAAAASTVVGRRCHPVQPNPTQTLILRPATSLTPAWGCGEAPADPVSNGRGFWLVACGCRFLDMYVKVDDEARRFALPLLGQWLAGRARLAIGFLSGLYDSYAHINLALSTEQLLE